MTSQLSQWHSIYRFEVMTTFSHELMKWTGPSESDEPLGDRFIADYHGDEGDTTKQSKLSYNSLGN